MKHLKFQLISLCFLALYASTALAQSYSGGSGTSANPYLISSKADMEALATATNGSSSYSTGKYFLLTQDITDPVTTIIGIGTSGGYLFQGTFDGGGHFVTVNISTTAEYVGVFGCAYNATIKNLGVKGSVTKNSSSSFDFYVGGICGFVDSSTITNCYNTATVSATSSYTYTSAGGICGYVHDSTITNCYNTATVSATSSSSSYAGGICGDAYSGDPTITSCYNTATVSATSSSASYAGGICGLGYTITSCYNTATVSATSSSASYAGGICGLGYTITSCYNTATVSASSSSSSSSYAGGICGYLYSKISNCVSFNSSITAIKGSSNSTDIGRIVSDKQSGTIENCYANPFMTLNDLTVSSTDATSKNGKDLFSSNEIFSMLGVLNSKYLQYGDTPSNINPDNLPVTFSLSNNSIIDITNNILTVLKPGNVTITCNYNFEGTAYQIDINQTVNKAPLTIQANTLQMIYGDTPPIFTCTYTGFVNGENASVLTALPSFSCSAGSTSNADNYSITPSGAAADNYSFTYINGQLQIVKRDLLVTPRDTTRIYGNYNPSFTLSYSGFVNGDTASNVSTKPTASTTANAQSPIGNYPVTLSGGSATNYNLILQQGNLEVTKASLTVTPVNTSRLYGAANPAFSFSYSGFKNSETKTVLSEEPQATSTAVSTSPVGTYPVTCSGGSAQNYSFVVYNTGTLTINKAPLTIQADTLQMIYGDTPPTFTCHYSGFVNGENASVLTTLPTYTCSGTATSNIGNYTIYPSGAAAENYSLTYKNGQLQIGKRDLHVVPDNFSREYGEDNSALTLQYSGFVNGNTASIISTKPTASTTAVKTSPVGNYAIICSGGSNLTNYSYVYDAGILEVTKAPLTITANSCSRYYGYENPVFTLNYSGFKNSENSSVLQQAPQISCNATQNSPSGNYTITVSGGQAQNYDFVYQNGVMNIREQVPQIMKFYRDGAVQKATGVPNVDSITFAENNGKVLQMFKNDVVTKKIRVGQIDSIKFEPYSLPSNLYMGIIGFNSTLNTKSISPLGTDTRTEFTNFVSNLTSQQGTILYYAVDNALNALDNVELPVDLVNVSMITFTDGLDQGSHEMNGTYNGEDAPYLAALNSRIHNDRVFGMPINAYTIGIRGSDVTNTEKFRQNLQNLASSPENVTEVTNMSEVNAKFQEIAQQIYSLSIYKNVSLKIPGQPNGTKIRFTFDNVSDAANSSVFIEGTYRFSDKTLQNIIYKGLTSANGTTATGEADGIFYTFTFNSLQLTSGETLSTSYIKQWAYDESADIWQKNSEFTPETNTNTNIYKKSALIMLVLDCSSSLGSQFNTMQTNANNFISTMANNVGQTQKAVEETDNYPELSNQPTSIVDIKRLNVHKNDATVQSFNIEDIRKLSYAIDKMFVYPASGTTTSFAYNNLHKFTFDAIDKLTQTISFDDIPNKQYGDATFTLNATSSSGLPISYASSNSNVISISGNTATVKGAGTVTITALQAGNNNYNATSATRSIVVNKAPLTITADNATREYGAANPAFTLSYSGFVNSENASVLDALPSITCAANVASPAGNYDITLSGGSDNNYSYTLVDGTLEVTATTDIDEVSGADIHAFVTSNGIQINGCNPQDKVSIYNVAGQQVYSAIVGSGFIPCSLQKGGIYIIRTPQKSFKVVF